MEASVLEKPKVLEKTEQPTSSSKKVSLSALLILFGIVVFKLFGVIQKYEFVWKAGFILVLGIGAVLFSKVYTFQTHPAFDSLRQGTLLELLIYGLSFGLVFTLFDHLTHRYFDDLCLQHYITEEKYIQPEARKKRCYTLVKWGYSLAYYLISSIWCYRILCGTRFMPTWLGGLGSPYVLIQQGPRVLDATLEMKIFYILQFGKHFARFFGHLFIRAQGNFFQYALHHGLSVFLILFSYLTNQWLIGLFVLLIHDYSDFALITARAYRDYKHYSKKLLDMIYVHAFVAWVGCRIVLFLGICIIPAFQHNLLLLSNNHPNYTQFEYSTLGVATWFMVFMMMGLEVLHLYWTYYIAESFVATKISAKAARHSYD